MTLSIQEPFVLSRRRKARKPPPHPVAIDANVAETTLPLHRIAVSTPQEVTQWTRNSASARKKNIYQSCPQSNYYLKQGILEQTINHRLRKKSHTHSNSVNTNKWHTYKSSRMWNQWNDGDNPAFDHEQYKSRSNHLNIILFTHKEPKHIRNVHTNKGRPCMYALYRFRNSRDAVSAQR